jgi:hypothetical protein
MKSNLSARQAGKKSLRTCLSSLQELTHLLISSKEETLFCVTTYSMKCYLANKESCPLLGGEKGVGLILYQKKSNEISKLVPSFRDIFGWNIGIVE